MIRNSGHADLPLHTGTVPRWLADRMMMLGSLIVESLVINYGPDEVLTRLSDPLWFQSLGAVMGMDWHSSGITTSVMYALKRGINARAKELGIYICGGRGKYSRMTPQELLEIAGKEGFDGDEMVKNSRLVAKVDNNAVQDGFQLYQHNFIVTKTGKWAVVQQGMNVNTKTARRYHWCSSELQSFVEEPHTAVVGQNKGAILNLTDQKARTARDSILDLSLQQTDKVMKEIMQIGKPASQMILMQGGESIPLPAAKTVVQSPTVSSSGTLSSGATQAFPRNAPSRPLQGELFEEFTEGTDPYLLTEGSVPSESLSGYSKGSVPVEIETAGRSIVLPRHHEVLEQDVDLKRLGGVLATAYESQPKDFESLLLTPGLGPRTLQSLALVSEVIYGTPSRFTDPARFSFAHGGKDGHPFPVPLKIYDESIRILHDSIEKSKLGYNDKSECIKRLHNTAQMIEKNCAPEVDFDAAIKFEREHSSEWDGKTV